MKSIDPQVSPASSSSSHRAWSAVLLLLTSYALVLLSPIAFASLRLAADGIAPSVRVADWVPGTLAIGLALLGGAAMVTVLKRLVRELEFSPYPGVAAAFGVLMGSALIALRAPFHLGNLDSGVCAVLCIMVSITGGALAVRAGTAATMMGGLIALAPAPLLLLLFSLRAESDQTLQGVIHQQLSSVDRTFLGLVALFGLLLWLAAITSRSARKSSSQRHGVQYWRAPLANEAAPLAFAGAAPAVAWSEDDPILLTRPKTRENLELALAPTIAGPLAVPGPIASEPTSRVSVWSFHDAPPRPEDFELPPLGGRRVGVGVWLSLLALAVLALGAVAWWVTRHG